MKSKRFYFPVQKGRRGLLFEINANINVKEKRESVATPV